jgi:leucyl-tRNA synthetase
MKGFNVLCPMGWDAFGLPTENYAIRMKINPTVVTEQNIKNAKIQAKRWGLSIDWEREVNTTDPKYYKWTQWIFLQWYKKGLAFKKEMPINWCPACKIGLANEEVIAGKCERCGAQVTRKNLKQWVVKITEYAERLIEGLENTAFIEKVKAAQINWIGKSEGAEIDFKIVDSANYQIKVFTTRPDTLYGATFMVVAPEHELVTKIINLKTKGKEANLEEIKRYLEEARKKSDLERTELIKEKTGVFLGLYALNPMTGKKIPVWVSDFVLPTYGTGAIMAVPAHDQRDFDFAKKYGLPILPVIKPPNDWDFDKEAYTEVEEGITINSPCWNNMKPSLAIKKAIEYLEEKGIGKKAVSYHLRDWIFSRQHYWGEPIPVVYCPNCAKKSRISNFKFQISNLGGTDYAVIPVPEDQLPVKLPYVQNYKPTDTGESPLAAVKEWVNTQCPVCGGPALRETDTMPNWAGSDWYFLRYIDPENDKALVDLKKAEYWLPVDIYVGGDEHNTLHLLYSRFTYQFLWDIGAVPKSIPEPYFKRLSHGVILGPDCFRMSKSRGNVINPDEVVEAFGADALRVYLMFIGPFEATLIWSQEGLEGCFRFLKRVWNLVKSQEVKSLKDNKENKDLMRKLHQTIKKVGEDIEQMKFNTAVAAMMELVNEMTSSQDSINKEILEKFLLILAPFAPHITEELWEKLGNKFSIHQQKWPEYDSDKIKEETVTIAVQINGKLRGTVEVQSSKCKVQSGVEELARESEKIKKYLEGQEIKKVIFVPGKLINFVL